jgi:tellurite resistance protein TerC
MLLHVQLKEIGFTTMHSLIIIIVILSVSIGASLIWPVKKRKLEKSIEELTGEETI